MRVSYVVLNAIWFVGVAQNFSTVIRKIEGKFCALLRRGVCRKTQFSAIQLAFHYFFLEFSKKRKKFCSSNLMFSLHFHLEVFAQKSIENSKKLNFHWFFFYQFFKNQNSPELPLISIKKRINESVIKAKNFIFCSVIM